MTRTGYVYNRETGECVAHHLSTEQAGDLRNICYRLTLLDGDQFIHLSDHASVDFVDSDEYTAPGCRCGGYS